MTLLDVPNYVYYSGDGGTTSFPFPYKFFEDDEIDVYSITPTATTLLTAGYSISKTGSAPYDSCNVVMAAAPAAGTTLYIERICEISQETDLPTGGAFLESVIEGALDRLTMIAQQLDRDIGRGIKIPVALATSGTDLDFPSPLANALIGWNAAGTALENKTVASIGALVTTSFTETFMSSVTDQAGMRLYSGTSTAAEILATLTATKWVSLTATTDFNTTPTGTSTIVMVTDQTANIKPGMALKYELPTGTYYGICNSIGAALLTIGGAPLSTGAGDLTALSYTNYAGQVIQVPIMIPGYFADATETTLLASDNLEFVKWMQSDAFLARMSVTQMVPDSGAENTVNCYIGGVSVLTTPLTLSATSGAWTDSVVEIDPTRYGIANGDRIEIGVNKVGNGDCTDLSVILTFVGE